MIQVVADIQNFAHFANGTPPPHTHTCILSLTPHTSSPGGLLLVVAVVWWRVGTHKHTHTDTCVGTKR